ncbi:MAG: leucyl/phenylalanyl-tRNA--protein transferase [Acidobacteria bacterium]|nr:MAG: leucyl/phenylalanyl-tRNA--protein transferase [Acidobacteriota bacterium]REJ99142.1 MAG: leucyl/phenylalanyl-tRNA--protein transferase [Acidobacteriota bacterium]REK16137.1 MAG: leucyl/phenylalanyl-tRNA--protein transferase [Acidobacteriota bacterium]REK43818.1 MAG: leucyl/phenylalanyl-tRNA--protein transferase [Acidobacteriota bacterium]
MDMSSSTFPDPKQYGFPEWVKIGKYYFNAADIISFGDELTVENVLEAYAKGIFPWHIPGLPLPWFCPASRAILRFEDLTVPRSLAKFFRNTDLVCTIDKAFREVIVSCAKVPRTHEAGTWITDQFIDVYTEVHKKGHAHSVEVWDGDELVGGLYGVDAGGVFCGESMFFVRSNASKIALLTLVEHLKEQGSEWIDIQVMTPHFEKLGATEIPREVFLKELADVRSRGLKVFPGSAAAEDKIKN